MAEQVLDISDHLNEACAICFKSYGEIATVIFPCGSMPPHRFCHLCIEAWRRIALTCPMCRGVACEDVLSYKKDNAGADSIAGGQNQRGRRRKRRGHQGLRSSTHASSSSCSSNSSERKAKVNTGASVDIFSMDSDWMTVPQDLTRVRNFLSKNWKVNDGSIDGCDQVLVLDGNPGISSRDWLIAHYGRFSQIASTEQRNCIKRCETLAKRTGILTLGKAYFTLLYYRDDSPMIIKHQLGWRAHDTQLMFRRVPGLLAALPPDIEDSRFDVKEVIMENEEGVREKLELSSQAMRQLKNFDEPQAIKFMNDIRRNAGIPASVGSTLEFVGPEGQRILELSEPDDERFVESS